MSDGDFIEVGKLGAACVHGQLARSCNICELEARVSQLKTELKNFLGAFDTYFEACGRPNSNLHDAKEAMFSAANTAREVLID